MDSSEGSDSNHGFWYYLENYFLHLLGFLAFIILLLLFHLRKYWFPRYRNWRNSRHNQYLSLINQDFQDDINQGLTSNNFNLFENNIGDEREGLDETSKKKIIQLMNTENLSFDEARLKYSKQKMKENQIGEDGMPLDPKAFTFS